MRLRSHLFVYAVAFLALTIAGTADAQTGLEVLKKFIRQRSPLAALEVMHAHVGNAFQVNPDKACLRITSKVGYEVGAVEIALVAQADHLVDIWINLFFGTFHGTNPFNEVKRNLGTCNVVFVDGHVDKVKSALENDKVVDSANMEYGRFEKHGWPHKDPPITP